jgi:nucleotide-binding universal stress UspA family protein
MKKHTLEAAPAAGAVQLRNNNQSVKAKRILVGVDVHLRGYQTARKIDNGPIGVVENFRSEVELLLYVEKQLQQATEQVVVVYEAGPLGYTLYRKLRARGVLCYVSAPDSGRQRKKRVKNNKIDARSLTSQPFNYLNGDQNALQLAAGAQRGAGTTAFGQPATRSTGPRTQARGRPGQRHALEPGFWELEQLVATEGLEPVVCGGGAVAGGKASDLG